MVVTDPSLLADLKELVEPSTRGDPQWRRYCGRRRACASLAGGLRELGHRICHNVVADLLRDMGYSLQANRKTLEGANHPDRDVQFGYINAQVKQALAAGEPAISVDTKKKELVGDFKNAGREYRPKGQPMPVRVHDFLIPELGRAAPYGVYDIADNAGWVSLGIDHDTASFAVNAIRRWWQAMGCARYPQATHLLVTADCGGRGCVMKAPATVTAMIFQMPGPSRSGSSPPPGVAPSLRLLCALAVLWSTAIPQSSISSTFATRPRCGKICSKAKACILAERLVAASSASTTE